MWGKLLCPMDGVQPDRWVAYRQNVRLHRVARLQSLQHGWVTEMLFTFRSSLIKIVFPYLTFGRSATSVIPGILGLAFLAPLCVSW